MGINFSFFKTPKHNVFNYTPLYYDERKEHREMVKQEALREKSIKEGKEWKDENYYPGKYIKGKLTEDMQKHRKHALNTSLIKIITIATVLIFIIFLIFFAKYFQVFLQSLR